MSWVKLDDGFFRHPKVLAAGRDARELYVAGLCYCGSGLTDGRIPAGAVRVLGAEVEIDQAMSAADRLVSVGLWERDGSDFVVHDYLEYQPSKERVLATREARTEAGRRGGKQKSSNLLEVRQDGAQQNASKLPSKTSSKIVANAKQNSSTLTSRLETETETPKGVDPL
jgi:hypothetical protein